MKSKINLIVAIFMSTTFTNELVEFMLSKTNRLANLNELAEFLNITYYNYFKNKGWIYNKIENTELPTSEQLFFARISNLIVWHEVAHIIYERLYNKAILRRICDTDDINFDINTLLQKIYLKSENDFFDDKNLEIIFDFINKNS